MPVQKYEVTLHKWKTASSFLAQPPYPTPQKNLTNSKNTVHKDSNPFLTPYTTEQFFGVAYKLS